ncbi:MAG TPA: rod shape-determining protein MreC [Planctomycetota bacterium]|nr:rod shape-determining protein MreC [Planctomycetota bacterium]
MNRRYFHIIFILLAAISFIGTLLPQARHDEMKGSVLTCMAPAQESATFVRCGLINLTETLDRVFAGKAQPDALRRANDEIRRLRQLLAVEKGRAIELERMIDSFAAFEDFAKAGPEKMKVIPAMIIGRDATLLPGVITINRGSNDGVRKGAGVVWGHSAVGVVAVARPTSSLVNLLTNPSCKIPAYIQRTGESTLVEGTMADSVRMRLVNLAARSSSKMPAFARRGGDGAQAEAAMPDSVRMRHVFRGQVVPGDLCLTSGELATFPRNIIIGEVTEATLQPGSIFPKVAIRPNLSVSALQAVIVLVREDLEENVPAE